MTGRTEFPAPTGCALGLDATAAAGLAYRHTHTVAFAAITAAGAVTVSTAALIVALHAVARSQRGH